MLVLQLITSSEDGMMADLKQTILVVDDSAIQRKIIRTELLAEGYEVIEAENGVVALAAASMAKVPPDLITLDVEMPHLNGFETCEKFREPHYSRPFMQYKDRRVPIIFITAHDTLEGRQRGFGLGASDFIIKPFEKGQVARVVNRVLQPRKQVEGRSVLVVDDSKTVRDIVSDFLVQQGFIVYEAENGREAWDKIRKMDQVDLVVTDFMMPEMNGDELCSRIRGDQKFNHLPVIFLSAAAEQNMILQFYDAGATDYLMKPFAKEELLARVLVHLDLAYALERLEGQTRKTQLILDHAGDGIIGVDQAGDVNFANPVAIKILGWQGVEFAGQSLMGLLCPADDSLLFHPKANAAEDCFSLSDAYSGRQELRRTGGEDGETYFLDYVHTPMLDGGCHSGAVIIFTDITQRLAAEHTRKVEMERVEEELKVARHFQQALLPKQNSISPESGLDLAFYLQPSSQISGDFLIIDTLDEEHVAIMIIDVMGHGVKSGLATIQAKTLFNEYIHSSSSPAAVLRSINAKSFNIMTHNIFMTAILLVWNMKKGTATVANAGGVPLLHYRSQEGVGEIISLDSNPIGITAGDDFLVTERELSFGVGDFLLLQTDGLIEAANVAGVLFDDYLRQKKVIAAIHSDLSSAEVVENLLLQAKTHSGSASFADDVTLVVLKHLGV